jgi:hypothetical protein
MNNEVMKANFKEWADTKPTHRWGQLEAAWNGWQAALSQQPAQPTVKDSLTVQAQPTEHVMGLLGAACYVIRKYEPESNLLQKIRDVTFDRKPAQPSCEPVAWRLDWQAEISLGAPRFAGRDNPEYKDRMVLLGANAVPLYASTPDYEVLRVENEALKAQVAMLVGTLEIIRKYPDFDDSTLPLSKMMDQAISGNVPELLKRMSKLANSVNPIDWKQK